MHKGDQGADLLAAVAAGLASAAVALKQATPADVRQSYIALAESLWAQAVRSEGYHSLAVSELEVGGGPQGGTFRRLWSQRRAGQGGQAGGWPGGEAGGGRVGRSEEHTSELQSH